MSIRRMIKAWVVISCFWSVFSVRLHAESGIYDRIGIISEHGLHGAVPEENIDLFTGNLTLKNLDIHLPGPNGFDLNIWRVYNSKILKDRLLGSAWGIQQEPYSWVGLGWSMHMGRLHSGNTETPVIEYPDGRWETAYRNINDDGTTFLTRDFAKLDKSSWKLYFKDGTVWTFGALADVQFANMVTEQVRVVTQITNSYGHQINITYDIAGSPRMKTITDSMGRTVNFTLENNTLNKLNYISVKNATGTIVYYDYTVDEFNGDFFKLTAFDPPVLNPVTYVYGNGLTSNWELLAVNTSYGGRMEYEYADQTFYYQVYALQTKVIREKRIRFSSTSDFKTWTYSYPSYYNTATGTVEVTGPAYTTYAKYHAYTTSAPWQIGLLKEKSVSDGSFSEQYEWISKTIHDVNQWYVLNVPMGYPKAPLQSKVIKSLSGDADISEVYSYERTKTSKYGLPTQVSLYENGNLKNSRKLTYYFESVSSFETKYMLNQLKKETYYNSSNTRMKETEMTYFSNGAVDSIKKWESGTSYLTWNYGYSSSNPNLITITIDQPGAGGTETLIYKYGVLATLKRPGYTEYTRTISSHDSSILSETNRHGGVMSFSYDGLGRITAIDMPSGFNNISATWSTTSVTIAQGNNSITKYWDGMGRDTGFTEGGDGVTLYFRKVLDSDGRTVYESKGSTSLADTYDYVYNAAGHLKQITDPRGKTTTITLGADQKTVKDANGHSSIFEYADLPGLVTRLTDPSGKLATYAYDGLGRLLNTTYNSNRTQSYTYNGLDQVITEAHPETGTITYAYDPESNLETKTWGGKTTSYTYNASNQVRTDNAGDEMFTFAYDAKGRVSSITSNSGWSKTSIGYNLFGNITQETITIPGLAGKTIHYAYDLNNQLKEITYPDGRKTSYTNNGLNMPETIAFNGSTLVNAIAYGIGKQPTLINISANGTSYSAEYNKNGSLWITQLKKSGAYLYNTEYQRDGVGNIATMNNSTPAFNAIFSYDEYNRLTGASYSPSGVGRVNNFVYNYDAYGNMTQAKENGSTVFSQNYTNKNQISGYAYDRGNLTSDPLYDYDWDNRNRFCRITNKLSGESEGTFAYDERGMRLKAVRALIPELALTAPNGGENWVLDTVQPITWNSKNIGANLKLELLKNGIPMGGIVENLTPATTSYAWTVGHFSTGTVAADSGYSIRISAMDGSISDTGDGTFSLQQAQLAITAPNGGENWQANTQHNISWTANFTGSVAIDLYKGGSFIANIGSALAETGTAAWTISTTLAAATDYRIRISQGAVEDYSNNAFSISPAAAPTLAITYPNGGETLLSGAASHVNWTSANLSPDELVQVDYSSDNGANWLAIGQTQNLGTISWTVPTTASTTCLARVGRVSTMNGPVNDISNNVFTITSQPLQITSPVGGESWLFKSYQNITWVATGITGNVRIRLFQNGTLVGPIVDIAASAGTYSWKVGAYDDPAAYAAAGSGYAIQIKSLDVVHLSTSPGTFSIYKATGALELTSPSGGERWQAGSERTITWSGGKDIRELQIEYSTDLGSSYHVIDEHAPNTGSYSWHVPETVSGHCLVRISDAEGQATGDNTAINCDLAVALRGREMDTVAPLLSLWLKSTDLNGEAARNNSPLLSFGRSELIEGYKLSFGEYSADLADATSLFDKNHKIKVQWDIMHARGTVYFDDKPIFKDIPLMPVYGPQFSPVLTLGTGSGISTLRLDDFCINLLQQDEALSSEARMKTADSGQSDEPADASTLLLIDDFESYRSDESLLPGGWSANFKCKEAGCGAKSGLSGQRGIKAGLVIDSKAPISGLHSGNVIIPDDSSLILSKPISLPNRLPFAVSAKPFAIIHAEETRASNEDAAPIHPEGNTLSPVIDDGIEQNLRGPHAGIPTTATPVIGRTTLYGTTYYIYSFDGKLLAEYDAAGVCQKDYIYMGSKLLAEYQPVIAKYYYYTSDQINSTRIITDGTGTVVYSALFDPYGGMQKQWVNTYSPSLKFSGKERESGSEMDYFAARYYDHLRYRFISADPLINKDEAFANPQLWNLYSYCRNNPITFFDPDGRWSKEVHDKIIDTAFPGEQNENMRNIFKEASAYIDSSDQSISGSYKHAMRAPWQSVKEAEIQMNQFLTEMKSQYKIMMSKGKKDEAYYALGMAMHTLMDSTSPIHEGFQNWGNMDMFNPTHNALGVIEFLIKGIPHLFESSISSKRIEKSVGLIQSYLKENQK